jgi:enoyl-CoA hydratase
MDESRYQYVGFERRGKVLRVSLRSGAPLNAVTAAMHEELARLFYDLADDVESHVIVLTGSGQAFSAGGDANWLKSELGSIPEFYAGSRAMRRLLMGLIDCPKPVIARVNGDAIGVGATIALLCDIIIAVDSARFGDPHVRLGLVAGDGGALIWPHLMGFAKAKQYLLTGELIGAVEAVRCNLVNFAVPLAELDPLVDRYADTLAAGAQTAIRYTKSVTNLALRQLFNSVGELGIAYEGLSKHTADYREGINAFLAKRKPYFGESGD